MTISSARTILLIDDDVTLCELLAEHSPEDTLLESMRVEYHRITLVDTVDNERVTIDVGLRLAFAHECSAFPNVAIVEVKRAQRSRSAFLASSNPSQA